MTPVLHTPPATRSSPCEIVPLGDDRLDEVLLLLSTCLGEKPFLKRDRPYWHWKHRDNPFGPSLVLLALAEGRVAGLRAFLRWEFSCGGRAVRAVRSVDSVTHPDFRRRGIFTALTTAAVSQARDEGVELVFNTPNQNSMPGYLKLGWRHLGRLRVCIRMLSPLATAGRWLAGRLRRPARPAPDWQKWFRREPPSAAEVLRDERLLPLLGQPGGSEPRLATCKSLDFLRWRYTGHPHIPYFAETLTSGGRLAGTLFYRLNLRAGLREVLVDEVFAAGESGELARELLKQLGRRLRADYLAAHAAAGSWQRQALRAAGFRQAPLGGAELVARPLAEGGQRPYSEIGRWSLSLGDMEGL